MRAKILLSAFFLSLISFGLSVWFFGRLHQIAPQPKAPEFAFREVSFRQLPGWNSAQLKKSLATFQISCRTFMRQDPEQAAGATNIDLRVKDWQPACTEALAINPITDGNAKAFFHTWFAPVEFFDKEAGPALFTGYYVPALKGSYTRSKEFNVPLYETPDDLVTADLGLFFKDLKNRSVVGHLVNKHFVPYYTREEISKGAIKGKTKVIAWIHSPVDRLFLEIQGSGDIELDNGDRISVGYDAQNGRPYRAIASVLIRKGILTRDTASMQAIRRYLDNHPEQLNKVINTNQSFVFFRKMKTGVALGSQGVALTPGYSLAVDRQWVPMGTPLWLDTQRPGINNPEINKPFQRLMIAQDTGGAIRGKVRGDIFWGGGEHAAVMAGHMRHGGRYWLLLPKQAVSRLDKEPKSETHN